MLNTSILSYEGPLSFSTIDQLLSEFKIAAQRHEIPFRTYKRMVSVMIEALENVTKYSGVRECESNGDPGLCPSCQINLNSSLIELITRNPVMKSEVSPLRERIDFVNRQDNQSLRELYRSTITDGKFSAKGGAGLGFIEIAKTTKHKLEYSFEDLSGEYALYTLRAVLEL